MSSSKNQRSFRQAVKCAAVNQETRVKQTKPMTIQCFVHVSAVKSTVLR